jgi:membrane fusion protein, multidrug efflux system
MNHWTCLTTLALATVVLAPLPEATAQSVQDTRSAATAESGNGIRALVVPRREARLSSQITARIVSIGPEPGTAFAKGKILVTFDCRSYRAEHRKARAELLAASKKYENRKELSKLQSGSLLELDLARAEELRVRAALDSVEATLSGCKIRAPYHGRVVSRLANAHESVTPGTALIEILDERDLDARIIAPSRWLRWLKTGQALKVRIEELDRTFPARVRTIGSRVDPVSQPIEITAGIVGDIKALKPGMSGIALFPKKRP